MTVAADSTQAEPKQAKIFARQVKLALVNHEMTVSALARRLGYARNTVSLAIHHGVNRRAVAAIRRFLAL